MIPTQGSQQGNPWHPLPRDYPDLTEEGQKQARIWAVSRHDTPEEFVESWALFRSLYFAPSKEATLYKTGLKPSPPAHYEWVGDFWRHTRNLLGAPRASSKSTVLGKEVPLLLSYTQPGIIGNMALATDRLVEERFDNFMEQTDRNEFLINDFGVMKPARGSAIWNHHRMTFRNGSILCGTSVESRKRGARPHYIIMDDPEYDPNKTIDETSLLKNLETLMFRQLLPMLDPGCRLSWIGTMISRRAALWAASMGTDDRFKLWNRRIYRAIDDKPDGTKTYFWEEKWNAYECARIKRELGPAAWEAEFQNNPVSAEDRILHIEDPEDVYVVENGKIRWWERGPDGTPEEHERDYHDWLQGVGLLFTVDAAASVGAMSDFSSILVIGVDERRTWWVMDLFLGRVMKTRLIQEVRTMGLKWQPFVVGIESIGFQDMLRQDVEAAVEDDQTNLTWQPRIYPVKYPPRLSKSSRAAGLSSKNSRHQIKFPSHLRHAWPMRELFKQFTDFTMDLALLPNDDALDCLSMVPYCPRPRAVGRVAETDDSVAAQILDGRTVDRVTGLPLRTMVNVHELPPDLWDMLRHTRIVEGERNEKQSKTSRPQNKLRRMGSPLLRRRVQSRRRP